MAQDVPITLVSYGEEITETITTSNFLDAADFIQNHPIDEIVMPPVHPWSGGRFDPQTNS